MASLSITEQFDVLKDITFCLSMGLVVTTMNQLSLKSSKETFHQRIVIDVADRLMLGAMFCSASKVR
jgi:hypothetical protein